MTRTVKRFIAGAICPRCAEMDKITMFEEDQVQFRECIACGFKDKQSNADSNGELPTRVNQPKTGAVTVEPVVFFRSSAQKKDD